MRKKLFLLMAMVMMLLTIPRPAIAQGALSGMAFLSEYVQTLYDEDSAIPVSQVKSALQTGDGFMWFAGYQGLMRYDGLDTVLFTAKEGFPSYNVNVLYEDKQGRLWVGTNDNGIVLYENNSFLIYSIAEGLPAASVRDISEDEEGNIYVATTNGIGIISADGVLLVHQAMGHAFASHIAYIGGGLFICLLNDGTIMVFNEGAILETYNSDYFGPEQPVSLFMSGSGQVYIGTAETTVYITDIGLYPYQALKLPSRQTINSFYEDSSGRIWICADNGLGYINNGEFVPVDGLAMSNSLECIYEDYEGSFWVGSSRQGLLQLARGKFTNISFMAGLPDYTVNTTAIFAGDLYIGADEGLIIVRDNLPIANDLTKMLEGVRIRCMITDSSGRLWICTYEKYGVIVVKPEGTLISINEEKGLASNKVRCIMEAQNGDMLVGMSGGVSIIRRDRVVRNYTKEDGLVNDVILSLAEDEQGIIYAGSDGGGIYAIDGDMLKNYTEKDGLGAGIILRMATIGQALWISTGNSICYMEAGHIRLIDKLAAFDDNVFDIREIGPEIWFLHSKGVNICNIANLLSDDDLLISQILKRDGLSAPVTANSWNALTEEGLMYVSTGKGVLRIDTRHRAGSTTIPLAAVSEVLADGYPLAMTGDIIVPSHTGRLDIHIALLSFASKDGSISYMLEGFDKEPITVARNELSWISYTNLKGGRYTFSVYGSNAAGLQSEPITLNIKKEFTLLEMPFTRLCLVFLVMGALVLGVRTFIHYRTKAVLKQRQAYKEITGQIMQVAAAMADSRNEYTAGHSRRVAEYSKIVGKRLGMSEDELETLYYAAILHDIGKSSIPDSILNKKGQLTEEEFAAVKSHVNIGAELLGEITVIADVALGAKYHHERVDGQGYGEGLAGDDIPLIAKIICVCNAFDSMLSDRPHQKGLSVERAQSELIHNAGSQFDERVTAILISLIHEGSVPL